MLTSCSLLKRCFYAAVGVSIAVTEIRYPAAAVWEHYKCAHGAKALGKSCRGVRKRTVLLRDLLQALHQRRSRRLRSAILAFSPEGEPEQD